MSEKIVLYDRLRHSAMFNLSLSSKELFHSNFIYWISEINKETFRLLISLLMHRPMHWDGDWSVKREYNNFDISVIDEKGRILFIIENKVKSIPLLTQLKKYASETEELNDGRMLLSLAKKFPNKSKIKSDWEIVHYDDLARALRKIRCKLPIHCFSYLDDYCDFIANFNDLVEQWEDENHSTFLPPQDKTLEELRIHDIYQKCHYARFTHKLQDKLNNSGLLVGREWNVNQGYSTRGGAFVEMNIYSNSTHDLAFAVQIQGKQYRHAIVLKSEGSLSSIEKINANKGWLSFLNPNNGTNGNFPTILTSSSQRNAYCKFQTKTGIDYIYEYKNIPDVATDDEMLRAIEEDMCRIIGILTP